MLFNIAWRNIWRSRTRSLVVIGAVLIGVWSILFIVAFSAAIVGGYVKNAIQNESSHFQLHHPGFVEDKEVKYLLDKPDSVLEKVVANPQVQLSLIHISEPTRPY